MTAAWEAAQTAARTSWFLARWWTASQKVSAAEERLTDGASKWERVESDFYTETRLFSECEVSEDSSGEAELEAEPETSDPEDIRDLHPGALLYKASKARNLPVMAEALAHGADVNLVNDEDEGKTPLIQAVIGVRQSTETLLT